MSTKPTDSTNKPSTSSRVTANIVGLVCVFLFMATAALMINGHIFGFNPAESHSADSTTTSIGDTIVINTTEAGKDITGYAGPVPLEIKITDGKIASVEALTNSETPGFFKRVVEAGLLDSWNGLTLEQASTIKVDGVTGATYSSNAVIGNVKAGLATYTPVEAEETDAADTHPFGAKEIAVLAVLMLAMIVPLFTKNHRYRLAQQILNAAILGFWGGTFLDYTMLLNVMSNAPSAALTISAGLMIVAAFIYPLLGKPGYYCAWVCPLGSLQELASACNPRHHLTLGPHTVKFLTNFRLLLWGVLMLCLWTAMWVSWIDYELFTAFIVESAATGILISGAVIVALSIFIPRPYCRFICPTGTLLRISQNLNNK
ncbi:MAG: FMN-binding protein [Bacteroides sp.]|nr:FMN-binding protein [Bacteroides sp.]MCM1413833.1 FMN-binding protein [Bacteroides sp.]MCM1471223.1 FMN-binding protein [Bacteroides sp.]